MHLCVPVISRHSRLAAIRDDGVPKDDFMVHEREREREYEEGKGNGVYM